MYRWYCIDGNACFIELLSNIICTKYDLFFRVGLWRHQRSAWRWPTGRTMWCISVWPPTRRSVTPQRMWSRSKSCVSRIMLLYTLNKDWMRWLSRSAQHVYREIYHDRLEFWGSTRFLFWNVNNLNKWHHTNHCYYNVFCRLSPAIKSLKERRNKTQVNIELTCFIVMTRSPRWAHHSGLHVRTWSDGRTDTEHEVYICGWQPASNAHMVER